jgi:hypothetical protein
MMLRCSSRQQCPAAATTTRPTAARPFTQSAAAPHARRSRAVSLLRPHALGRSVSGGCAPRAAATHLITQWLGPPFCCQCIAVHANMPC